MEKIDKEKALSYIDLIDDAEALKEFQGELGKYKNLVVAEAEGQIVDLMSEAAATTTPFTYIAFKVRQLEKKANELRVVKENITGDLIEITSAINKKIDSIEKSALEATK